jgi:serine/threonine protein phosphatase PrpC
MEAFVIRACGVSDTGRVRKTNEDRFVDDAELNLYAVADGMGGHRAGEVASKLAIEALTAFIRISVTDMDVTWPYGIDPKLSFDGNRLRTGIYLANRRVFRASESSDDYAGMGTTIVSVLIKGTQAAIGSVGDSRAYLISQGAIEQLTVDDSWAARILSQESGLAPDEVARHPMRHVLTNVVGARDTVDVHVLDGLHNVVQPAMMLQIVGTSPTVDSAARALIDKAIELGTRDNVTALVIRNQGNQ